jgi:hypothetical protein
MTYLLYLLFRCIKIFFNVWPAPEDGYLMTEIRRI